MPSHDVRSVVLPYCLTRQPDGRYVVLNRNYKPVGMRTQDYLTYADFPVLLRIKGLGKTAARKLSFNGNENLDSIYLYNDACVPTDSTVNMVAYLERLKVLASLSIADE